MANDTYTINAGQTLLAGWPSAPVGDVPAPGQAKNIAGYNWIQSVRPPTWSSESRFRRSVFNSYGSGVFNPHYSDHGAFCIAGTGGHGHTPLIGGVLFDFTTRLPVYVQAEVPDGRASDWTPEECTGLPWYEVTAHSAFNIPAPPHIYKHLAILSPQNGGGALGSVLHVGRAAVTTKSLGTTAVHAFNLLTGVWTRKSLPENSSGWRGTEGSIFYDATLNRYWTLDSRLTNTTALTYWDPATSDYHTYGAFGAPPNLGGNGPTPSHAYGQAWLHEGGGRRLIIYSRMGYFYGIDLASPTTWTVINTSGAVPLINQNAWCYHEAHGVYYWRGNNGQGQSLLRMRPPADPLLGTWAVDSITVGGDVIPEYHALNVDNSHYRSLFYIPSMQMLGWVTPNGVALINPEPPL